MNGQLPDCLNCGLCCRQPVGPPALYPEDLERWANEGMAEIGDRLNGCRDAVCPFLIVGPGCRCAIYPTRPLVCRHFAAGGSACLELRLKSSRIPAPGTAAGGPEDGVVTFSLRR